MTFTPNDVTHKGQILYFKANPAEPNHYLPPGTALGTRINATNVKRYLKQKNILNCICSTLVLSNLAFPDLLSRNR